MKILLALILLISTVCFAGTVDTITVHSDAMQKDIKCVIIAPSNKKAKQLPVIYLLHGHSGNYAQWIKTAPQLQETVDDLNVLIVCPDGGFGSWYLDSPVDSSIRYETFITKELIPFIDKTYPTQPDRAHRAITGLSMGGHGGLYLSTRHLDLFGAGGSTSGGVDFRPFPNNWDLKKDLGDTVCCKANWDANVVVTQVEKLKNNDLKIIIDCGLGDFFLDVNRQLHKKLMDLKIDHDYIERPGVHNGTYWRNSIDYQMLFFKKYFEGEKTMAKPLK
jgi:S-formylglutathione hydrolase FrmB